MGDFLSAIIIINKQNNKQAYYSLTIFNVVILVFFLWLVAMIDLNMTDVAILVCGHCFFPFNPNKLSLDISRTIRISQK